MRISICFYGLHPNECFKGSQKHEDLCPLFWKKNVFDKNNVDIFLHSFDIKNKDLLLKEYNPVSFIFENQKKFPNHIINPDKVENNRILKNYNMNWCELQYCAYYGVKKTAELMTEYEMKHNFVYDFVLVTRIDVLWLKPLEFSKLKKDIFYLQKWGKDNIIGKNKNYREILGIWYLSNSNNIKQFSKLYDKLPFYLKNGFIYEHKLYKMHIDTITKNIKYKFTSSDDCDLNEIFCEKLRAPINKFGINKIKNLLKKN